MFPNLKKPQMFPQFILLSRVGFAGTCRSPSLCPVCDWATTKAFLGSEVKKDEGPVPPVCLQWAYCIIIALSDLSSARSWCLPSSFQLCNVTLSSQLLVSYLCCPPYQLPSFRSTQRTVTTPALKPKVHVIFLNTLCLLDSLFNDRVTRQGP